MYRLDINTKTYDIKLLVNRFGKKTGRTLKKTIKKTDFVKLTKRMKKTLSNLSAVRFQIPMA